MSIVASDCAFLAISSDILNKMSSIVAQDDAGAVLHRQ